LIEGSSATDSLDGCNGCNGCQEEGRRKKEEGRNYRSQVKPGNAFHCCCASSFLRGGRASRNSFLGRAKERDNESRNERFLRAGRARVKFIPWQSQGTRETGK
jgi:hypothetical protein